MRFRISLIVATAVAFTAVSPAQVPNYHIAGKVTGFGTKTLHFSVKMTAGNVAQMDLQLHQFGHTSDPKQTHYYSYQDIKKAHADNGMTCVHTDRSNATCKPPAGAPVPKGKTITGTIVLAEPAKYKLGLYIDGYQEDLTHAAGVGTFHIQK